MTSLECDRVPSSRPIATKEVPLVDRIEEMNVLKEALHRAIHVEDCLVSTWGEAEIGKARLVLVQHQVACSSTKCANWEKLDNEPEDSV